MADNTNNAEEIMWDIIRGEAATGGEHDQFVDDDEISSFLDLSGGAGVEEDQVDEGQTDEGQIIIVEPSTTTGEVIYYIRLLLLFIYFDIYIYINHFFLF